MQRFKAERRKDTNVNCISKHLNNLLQVLQKIFANMYIADIVRSHGLFCLNLVNISSVFVRIVKIFDHLQVICYVLANTCIVFDTCICIFVFDT